MFGPAPSYGFSRLAGPEPYRSDWIRAGLQSFVLTAFSLRETVPTSLENAIVRVRQRRTELAMNGCSDKIGPGTGAPRRNLFRWARRALFVAAATTLVVLSTADLAQAQSFRQGVSAFNRQDYARASLIFIPLAEQG